MGDIQTKIEMSEMPEDLVRYPDPPLPHKYHPPFRKFGKVQEKKAGRLITYTLSVTDPYQQTIDVTAEVFDKLYDVYNLKTEKIFIQGILKEEYVMERWVFLSVDTTQNQETILIRPFGDQTSHNFSSILCEVFFSNIIAKINCQYLHNIKDNFIIRTGIDLLEQPNSHVIVMERVDVTLSQIIAYKRRHLWDWTVGQFQCLTRELVEGLYALHKAGITHNDIRPSTIYYSLSKKCYVIGSYGSCMRDVSTAAIVRQSSRRSIEQISQIDRKEYDIFLLGNTLMSAFYLSEIVDHELAVVQNKNFIEKYQILKIVEAMIAPPDKRASIEQIRDKLPKTTNAHHYMYQMISSLKHRERPTPSQTVDYKVATSWAYKNLGLWNQWKRQYEQAFQLTETQVTEAAQAEGKMNLALIDHCRGQFKDSDVFAKDAAKKLRELGSKQLQEGNTGAAESYYKKAITCAKFYQLDADPDLAVSLTGLSIVHKDRSSYKYSKTLASAATKVIQTAHGRNSIEFGLYRLKQARLQTQFSDFQAAEKIIEDCITLSEKLKEVNQQGSLSLKAQSLVCKAKNYDKWGQRLTQLEQHSILDKSKTAAKEAVQAYQYIDQDHFLELADVVKTVGDINIKRRNYYQSIRQYSRAIGLINNHLEVKVKEEVKQKSEVLCLRGTAHSLVGQHQEGIRDYLEALKIYKSLYGSHHNRCSAVAIGNLGKIYANIKQKQQSRHCLKTCMEILSDVASRQDPDYLYFQQVERGLDETII